MLKQTLSVSTYFVIGAFALLAIVATMGRCDEPTITLDSLLTEMVDRDALARYPHAKYTSKQWSSYNRESVSPDKPGWFVDGDCGACLRTEQNNGKTEWVLMDQQGPGCLTRVWTPFFYNDFGQRAGPKFNIYLDGSSTPVVAEEMLGLIMGKSFVKSPLAYESVRAGDMYLPIAFAQGCKITTDAKPFYYIINSRAYASGTNTDSFTQAKYQAASPAIAQTGNALLHPTATQGGKTVVGEGTIQPGANLAMSLPTGLNAVRSVQIQLPVGQPEALRSTMLQITFDGQQTVRVPVGDMFSSSVRLNAFEDFARTVDKDGVMTCRWVMPYQKTAQVTLVNTGKTPVAAKMQATVGDWQWDDRSMYFHADWREERGVPTSPIRDWNYVTIQGKGVYVGDSLTVYNPVAGWWGEGDEKIYVDGETFPSHFGTGTEDYYGYAGGVIPDVSTDIYSRPFHGQMQVACKEPGYNVLSRIRSLDAIPFDQQFKFDMEISHTPELRQPGILVDYAVATFWYGMPGSVSVPEPPSISMLSTLGTAGLIVIAWRRYN